MCWAGLLAVLACVATGGGAAGELMLLDFGNAFDFARVTRRDATVAPAGTAGNVALRLETGHRQPWPGIELPAPNGTWDLSAFDHVALDVRNVGTNEATLCCRVDNTGADGRRHCNTGRIVLKPGERGVLTVVFSRKPAQTSDIKLFGMRGYPAALGHAEPAIDPSRVTNLVVFVPRPKAEHAFEIDSIRAGGSYQPPRLPTSPKAFFPFIDTFGQYIHKDWPGKTHSLDDLPVRLKAEREDLAAKPGPAGWNQFGGWARGPTLKVTGFFYPAKHKGKWWLVDPEGKLFFSHGIDCVRAGDITPIDDRTHWFQDFAGDKPEFKGFFHRQGRVVRGYYQGKRPVSFNFTAANALRKYGDDWLPKYGEMAHRRLRSWGLNTIANWSDSRIYLMKQPRRTPYVVAVHFASRSLEGSRGYWRKFGDVFDPDFKAKLRARMAREASTTAGDPWCIGYFIDNELSWGGDVSLAAAALASPPDQAAKKAFIGDLKAKYATVDRLNAAWDTKHASWDALLQHRGAPNAKRARADLTAFTTRTAETYFRTCREAVKEVAPSQLYLGCRFSNANRLAVAAAAKSCDVVSYNLYRNDVTRFRPHTDADVPLIIGEFHFGALDRGMFHTGLRPVKDQAARAAAYKSYVRGVLRHPQFVGCHWFKYTDEPTTGRALDGENYQIGFLDIVDTPYPETIAACREVGYALYEYRLDAK